jgi:hypothetical protein
MCESPSGPPENTALGAAPIALKQHWGHVCGDVLADQVGLGKTLTAFTIIATVIDLAEREAGMAAYGVGTVPTASTPGTWGGLKQIPLAPTPISLFAHHGYFTSGRWNSDVSSKRTPLRFSSFHQMPASGSRNSAAIAPVAAHLSNKFGSPRPPYVFQIPSSDLLRQCHRLSHTWHETLQNQSQSGQPIPQYPLRLDTIFTFSFGILVFNKVHLLRTGGTQFFSADALSELGLLKVGMSATPFVEGPKVSSSHQNSSDHLTSAGSSHSGTPHPHSPRGLLPRARAPGSNCTPLPPKNPTARRESVSGP